MTKKKTAGGRPSIMVSTRWEAARWCHSYDHVLTVFSPWWHCDWGHPDHKIVEFEDRYRYIDGAPTYAQVSDILGWAEPRLDGLMLIHCKAGQSRSTAVAVAVCALAGMGEDEAFDHVYLRCRPGEKVGERPFIPNRRVLELADEILGTRLVAHARDLDVTRDPEWLEGWHGAAVGL